jgi:hypothetical protein
MPLPNPAAPPGDGAEAAPAFRPKNSTYDKLTREPCKSILVTAASRRVGAGLPGPILASGGVLVDGERF